MKKKPGSNANEITYPKRTIIEKIITMRKKDFHLFLEIWSWKDIRSMKRERGAGFLRFGISSKKQNQ